MVSTLNNETNIDNTCWEEVSSEAESVYSSISQDEFNKKYILTDKVIGSGGFSEVFAGYRKDTEESVAVKVIDSNQMQYSVDEVEIMKSLSHRNIVKFYDSYEIGGQHFLVMEYLIGGELLDRILSKETYDEGIARDAFRNMLHALQYCHNKNIVHRDLKPDNLLLTSVDDDADLKLVDFGIATYLPKSGLLESQAVGTPGYTAPEVLLCKPYGKPADMWSMGVILYILLCGQFPFEGDEKVRSGKIVFQAGELENISTEAADLIRSLLQFNPARRLTVEQTLNHPWLQMCPNVLMSRDLSCKLPALRTFLARRKFKGGVFAVLAANKFGSGSFKNKSKSNENQQLLPMIDNLNLTSASGQTDSMTDSMAEVEARFSISSDNAVNTSNFSADMDKSFSTLSARSCSHEQDLLANKSCMDDEDHTKVSLSLPTTANINHASIIHEKEEMDSNSQQSCSIQ